MAVGGFGAQGGLEFRVYALHTVQSFEIGVATTASPPLFS